MTKFSFKLKKPYFWPVSGPFPQFFWKKKLPQKIWHVPCRNSEKPNDTIPRKQPNRQQDGRMDRPYFIGPFQLLLGVQQVQLQQTNNKSQRYGGLCRSNQELLPHSQHAKNSSFINSLFRYRRF